MSGYFVKEYLKLYHQMPLSPENFYCKEWVVG